MFSSAFFDVENPVNDCRDSYYSAAAYKCLISLEVLAFRRELKIRRESAFSAERRRNTVLIDHRRDNRMAYSWASSASASISGTLSSALQAG